MLCWLLSQLDAEAGELELQKMNVRKECDVQDVAIKAIQRDVDDLAKERDVVQSALREAGSRGLEMDTVLHLQANSQKTMESELMAYRASVRRIRDEIADAYKAMGDVDADAENTQARLASLNEQVCLVLASRYGCS